MTDLVTGGAGFIGRHVVRRLLADGRTVRVLDRDPASDLPDAVETVVGSAGDRAAVDRAMDGAERVFHVAGDPHLWAPDEDDFLAANLRPTEEILAAARRHAIRRVVVTSTAAIHFAGPNGAVPGLADMPGGYARSKFLSEQAALAAARDGLPVMILNPCLPIGAGDRHLTPPMKMIRDFLDGRHLAYVDFTLRIIHVDDLAAAYALAAERGEPGARYFLGGDPIRLSEVLAILERLSGRAMPRLKVPYALAYVAAAASEAMARYLTRRPPGAPLDGVRMTRRPPDPTGLAGAGDLGLSLRPAEEAFADAVRWLDEAALVSRARRAAAR